MKNFIIISLIAILMIIPTNIIKASTTQESRVDIREEIQKIAEEQLDILNIDQWNEFNKNLDKYQDGLLTNANLKETIINLVTGKFELNWKKIYESLG